MSMFTDFLNNYARQNSWGTFFTAALGAFAGAFAASRAHNKRTIVAELNALNSDMSFLCQSRTGSWHSNDRMHYRLSRILNASPRARGAS
jgi:hypothetical protein